MKHIILLGLLLTLSSCASKDKPLESPTKYLELNQLHAPKHKACIKHRDNLLLKAFSELDIPARDDENYLFVRNEKAALSFINHFDITKFTLQENLLEYQAIVKGCIQKIDPKHVTCDTAYPAYKFFRGLIYGMSQYQWSQPTIEKALVIALQYIKHIVQNESSLLDTVLANDLLMRLAQRNFVSETLLPETRRIRLAGDKIYSDLNQQLKKMSKKKITCKDAADFFTKERLKVHELSKELLALLAQTS